MLDRARAFCPAGISSFFEICDRNPDGTLLTDPEQIGARGGGFAIDKGVSTEVSLTKAKEKQVDVFINEALWQEAETTKTVVATLLEKAPETYHVTVRHRVEVPVGAGFGSSAAGAPMKPAAAAYLPIPGVYVYIEPKFNRGKTWPPINQPPKGISPLSPPTSMPISMRWHPCWRRRSFTPKPWWFFQAPRKKI